jgi:hypothetical protein
MDSPIAPAALRHADDGPAYDLISLGLVVFTILLITVWVSHFFRMSPSKPEDIMLVEARAAQNPETGKLTSAGELEVAKWAEFNLPSPNGDHITNEFSIHLKRALDKEAEERDTSRKLLGQPPGDGFDRVAVVNSLRTEGPARLYALAWYKRREVYLDACDTATFDVRAHFELGTFMKDLGLIDQERIQLEKIVKARPDLQGNPPLDDRGLPVIREIHRESPK